MKNLFNVKCFNISGFIEGQPNITLDGELKLLLVTDIISDKIYYRWLDLNTNSILSPSWETEADAMTWLHTPSNWLVTEIS